MKEAPVALITGAARRIGATIAKHLHQAGFRVIIHYRHSETPAQALARELNAIRPDSAALIQADFCLFDDYDDFSQKIASIFGQLDALINNASAFYPTPIKEATPEQWDELFSSNAKAPFFLSQALAPLLHEVRGSIVNIADIHGDKPLKEYPIYSTAKASLLMVTKALAKELAPTIRVNAIAPGPTLWPEEVNALSEEKKNALIEKTLLKRLADPTAIAQSVLFFIQNESVTGETLAIDSGRHLQ